MTPTSGDRLARSGLRLTADDHLFIIMEQVMDTPVIPQVIWRISVGTDPAEVDAVLHHLGTIGGRLAAGRLSRRVLRSSGPFRDRWEFTADAGQIQIVHEPVSPEAVSRWVEEQLALPIDSVHGLAWRFSAVPTTDGQVIVSLVRSHVVADGAAMIRAVTEAVSDTPLPLGGPDHHAGALGDALSLWAGVAASVAALLRPSNHHSGDVREAPDHHRAPTKIPGETPPMFPDGPVSVPTVAVRVDANHFAQVAASAGGTPNTLFQAITLGTLQGSGRVTEGETVPLSVPMMMRDQAFLGSHSGRADLRANATTGATISVTMNQERYNDLSALRTAAKRAYHGITERSAPDGVTAMAQVAQILPDAVVRRAANRSTTPLCLTSNLGEPDPAFTTLGLAGKHCDVALRSTIRAASVQELAQRQGGLSSWAVRNGTHLSISFTSLDPVHIHGARQLLHLVREELGRWGFLWGRDVDQWL